MLVHATCVALGRHGALLLGKPGSGKSDLALRFAFAQLPPDFPPPFLVADDQVQLALEGGALLARPPAQLAGRIEIRGAGIFPIVHCPEAEVRLAVLLTPLADVPRLPPEHFTHDLDGMTLPAIRLYPFEPSAPLKLAFALVAAAGGPRPPMSRE
jgi:serine kinase of HPr protein (carbohydrate metabolism regulator)